MQPTEPSLLASTGDRAGADGGSRVKVSVVVPVYNPGRHLEPLVDSLLGQTMPPGEFEAVFVDDGSTDTTPARLDELAARHQHFRVVHTPNSGWPGRPRNIGVAEARGEYVQFVDNDDWLGVEALERLYAYARAHDADVVVGKEVRWPGRPVHYGLFSKNRPDARLGVDPLLSPLTPHKMFRRAFLLEHGLRFAEGPRRLEDHPFVVEAYFLARRISVLSDYPVYCWHRRELNAGSTPRVWKQWYGYMEEALDVVEAHTEPGDLRDQLLSHWYRGKVLKMGAKLMASTDEAQAREWFDAAADLVDRRFPAGLDRFVDGLVLGRAALIRAGDFDGLRRLVAWERSLGVLATARPRVTRKGRVELEARAALTADGAPLRARRHGDRLLLTPPDSLPPLPEAALDVTAVAGSLSLTLETRGTGAMHVLRGRSDLDSAEGDDLVLTGRYRLDPDTAAGGRPLPRGGYTIHARVQGLWRGVRRPVRLDPAGDRTPATWVLVRPESVPVVVDLAAHGDLRVRVGAPLLEAVRRSAADWRVEPSPAGTHIVADLPGWEVPAPGLEGTAWLEVDGDGPSDSGGPHRSRLWLEPADQQGLARLRLGLPVGLPAGRHEIVGQVGRARAGLGIGVRVDSGGSVDLLVPAAPPDSAAPRDRRPTAEPQPTRSTRRPQMPPEPRLEVQAESSYARRSGDDLRLVLHLPDRGPVTGEHATLGFSSRKGRRQAQAAAEVRASGTGVLLEARVPRRDLPPAVWRLTVSSGGDGPATRLKTRLLTSDTQPVALLPGPVPRTRMAPPAPRPSAPQTPPAVGPVGRTVAVVRSRGGQAVRGVRSRLGRRGGASASGSAQAR